MRKRSMGRAAVIAAVLLLAAGCGEEVDEAQESAEGAASTLSSRLESTTRLTATLTGSSEVPKPGDPDATGTAMVNLDVSKTEVCYDVTVQKIDRPVGMHIHEGEAGKSGPVVVPLTTPTASDTTTSGCANADATLMGRIAANPGNFYVNVHSDAYPEGAVRGQLSQ